MSIFKMEKMVTRAGLVFAITISVIVFALFVSDHKALAITPTNGLVAEWKFDDGAGTTAIDSSGNGNTGTLLNGPLWIYGKVGGALSFDGIDDSVAVSTVTGPLNNMGAMTLSLWAYPKNLPSGFAILLRKKSLAPNARYVISLQNGTVFFNAGYTLARGSWSAGNPLSLNTWHHIVVVYLLGDTSSNPIIYIDGISQGVTEVEVPSGTPVSEDNLLSIGSNNSAAGVFNGLIDKVRIYNRLLNSSEVAALNQEVTPAPAITALTPTSGSVGALITIAGSGFTTTGNKVKFGDLGSENNPSYNLNSSDGRTLVFTVPASNYMACWSATPRCLTPTQQTQPGTYQVSVINANGTSNALPFMVTSDTTSLTLTLQTAGTGSGTVNGAGSYTAGATVTLAATPASGSSFPGWSPSPCAASFTMPANVLTCTATFTLNTSLETGNISIKRAGADLTISSAPSTSAWVDALSSQTANPASFTALGVGAHTAFATFVPGYTVSAGTCAYHIGGSVCAISVFSLTPTCNTSSCSVPVTVSSGQVTKVVFKYTANLAQKPNIVVIMTDDQDDTGSMAVMTRVNNLLAQKGVTFKNSFVENPLCCPSRATFLTGQVSHNNTVLSNNDSFDGGYQRLLPTEGNTLPVWLKQAGYQTAFIGKYPNGYPAGNPPRPPTTIAPGWDTWFQLVPPLQYYGYTINDNGTLRTYGNTVADYQTDVLGKKALDYISARASSAQPFFLWLTPYAPHQGAPGGAGPEPAPRHKGLFASVPLPQPPNFNEVDMSDKPSFMRKLPSMDATLLEYATESFRQRREALLAVDEMVGNIVDTLTRTGQLDNTLIIYTSDNGFFHGEHRKPNSKLLLYDESIRVPLIVRGPGVAPGLIRTELVSNVDLAATIVETAKASPGRVLDGRSLTPLLQNTGTSWRTALFQEGIDKSSTAGLPDYERYTAVRTTQFLYAEHTVLSTGAVEKEFYDLAVDPYELESRPNDSNYSSVVVKLSDMLRALKSCVGETCWRTDPEPQALGTRTAPATAPITALPQNLTKLDALTLQQLGPQDADETSWAPSPSLQSTQSVADASGASTSTMMVAIQAQIVVLQVQLVALLQQLVAILQAQVTH